MNTGDDIHAPNASTITTSDPLFCTVPLELQRYSVTVIFGILVPVIIMAAW